MIILVISSTKQVASVTVSWFSSYRRHTHNAQRVQLMAGVVQTLETGTTTAGLLRLGRVGGVGREGGACVGAVVAVAAELRARVSILH